MADRQADLNPQLGWPGGVCHTVKRVQDKVRSPRLQDKLVDKVEDGDKLTNPEAQTIYKLEVEKGTKAQLIKTMRIVPHAQYRMDQRTITVLDLRLALTEFIKAFYDAKSRNDYQFRDWSESFARGEPIRWVSSPRTGKLVVVFAPYGRGAVNIISTFWDGAPDPRPQECDIPRAAGYRGDPQGYRTHVKDPHPQKSDTGGGGGYTQQALPSPPHSRSKPVDNPPSFQGPGASGTGLDGRSVHKDMARTQGVPGQKHPDNPARTTPTRRPGMEAEVDQVSEEDIDSLLALMFKQGGMYPPIFPTGTTKQRKQKGRAYHYFKKKYKRTRGKTLQKAKRRYKRLRNNGRFKADRKRRRKEPERFERKPSGGALSVADRSKKYREKQKRKQDKKARAFLSPTPFVFMPTDGKGQIRSVDPDGMVNFTLAGGFEQLPFDVFMDEAFIYSEADLDDFFAYLDDLVGFDLDGEMAEFEPEDEGEGDPYFDAWNEGDGKVAVNVQFRARPQQRQRRQRGRSKLKSKQYYRKNRAKSKLRSRMRHKRVKNKPAFKRQQKHYRKNKNLFKRRTAEVLTVPDIAFVIGRTLDLGTIHSVSPMTGLVTYHRRFEVGATDRFESMPVARFLHSAAFLTDEDTDAFFELIEAELGDDAFDEIDASALRGGADLMGVDCDDPAFQAQCDALVGHHDLETMSPAELGYIDDALVTRFTYGAIDDPPHDDEDREPEEADPFLIDPSDDDLFYGKVWLPEEFEARLATFFHEKRPPKMDPDTVYDRAQDRKLKPKPKKKRPSDAPDLGVVERSNPGSRVLPGEGGHVDMGRWKVAALMQDIRGGCGPDLIKRSQGLKIRLKRVDAKNTMWHFSVPGSKESHVVRIKALRKGNVRDMQKTHVKVSCSCPFWQWQGPEHWAKTGDYLYGRPRGKATPPDHRDPGGQHRACKHVIACFDWVTSRKWQVPVPRKRTAGLRYLADTLAGGEVTAVFDEAEASMNRVAERYLQAQEVSYA